VAIVSNCFKDEIFSQLSNIADYELLQVVAFNKILLVLLCMVAFKTLKKLFFDKGH